MAYVSGAMYRSITPGRRLGQSPDAAVIESAYTVLSHYFPAQQANLDSLRAEALAALPDDQTKVVGMRYGERVARDLISEREGDGLVTPIASTSTFPTLAPGAGRLAAHASRVRRAADTVGRPAAAVLPEVGRPVPASASALAHEYRVGRPRSTSSSRTERARTPNTTQTGVAKFWSANVIRQYNGLARDVATARGSDLAQTARLVAMVNVVGADAQIAVMNAKYHYLFWRPVTAIDPTSVKPTGDGFGPVPGFDDGNAATAEQAGWRPLLTTPNHPEYPAAHADHLGEAAVFSRFSRDRRDRRPRPPGTPGITATRHFATAADLRAEIVNARVWAGLHYRFSGEAGARSAGRWPGTIGDDGGG